MRHLSRALILSFLACVHAPEVRDERRPAQLLVVTADDWNAHVGIATLYAREGAGWKQLVRAPVALGKSGLAWGRGLEASSWVCPATTPTP
jgi:hypothetical protein